jgi:hypothetical protein
MKHRKLRIAWSVAWGIACVLAIWLCVRSYTWLDDISYLGNNAGPLLIQSNSGVIRGGYYSDWGCRPGWTQRTLGHAPRRAGFESVFSSTRVSLGCPYWFLTPALAMLAAIPWAQQNRWRFSVRTLLIATTVVAALLGGLVAFDRAMAARDRINIKELYMAGTISLDFARKYTDEDVDRWPKPPANSSPSARQHDK